MIRAAGAAAGRVAEAARSTHKQQQLQACTGIINTRLQPTWSHSVQPWWMVLGAYDTLAFHWKPGWMTVSCLGSLSNRPVEHAFDARLAPSPLVIRLVGRGVAFDDSGSSCEGFM